MPQAQAMPANDRRTSLGLMLGAMGVVFGDIGTSPLYALRQTVLATEGGLPNHVAVMGSLSHDLLGADPGGDGQICPDHHARRQ